MNKKSKIMLVLLSAAVMTAGAFGIAGCGGKDSAENAYEAYVTYAEEHGQEVMTYENWLETIKKTVYIKGDTGATGADGLTGQNGAAGAPGDPGKTVDDIRMSDDGKKVEFIFTDNTKDSVALPDDATHVHRFDGNVVTLIPVSEEEDRDGLGYMVCEENGVKHYELVIINKYYNITVTDTEGEPVEGVDVVINGARATTNANGLARVQGFGNYNEYIISIDALGYTTDHVYKTSGGATQSIVLNRSLTQHGTGYDIYYTFDAVGAYTVGVSVDDYADRVPIDIKIINDSSTPKKYKLKIDPSQGGDITNGSGDSVVNVNGEYTVALHAGESVALKLTIEYNKWYDDMTTPNDTLYYSVEFEELDAPEIGTEELPLMVMADETTEIPVIAGGDGWVYYKWRHDFDDLSQIKFNLNNVQAEMVKAYFINTFKPFALTDTSIDNDTAIALPYGSLLTPTAYVFRVKANEANASFQIAFTGATDSKYGAQEFAVGNRASLTVNDDSTRWFKCNVSNGGFYTLVSDDCDSVEIYKGLPESDGTRSAYSIETGKTVIELTDGTYYFKVAPKNDSGNYSCGFTFKDYSEVTDKGYNKDKPISVNVDLTQPEQSFNSITSYKGINTYYSFTAPENGTLTVSGGNARIIYGTSNATSRDFNSGDTIIVSVRNDNSADPVTVNLNWTPATVSEPQPIAHTFTIRDSESNGIAGISVTIKDVSDGSVVATSSAPSGENGVVKVSFIPGVYRVELSDENGAIYTFGGAASSSDVYSFEGLNTAANDSEYNVRINNEKHDYTFTVQSGSIKFAGATVTLRKGATLIGTGTTDANGVVTVSNVFIPLSGEINYSVELAGEAADNYAISSGDLGTMLISGGTQGNAKNENITVEFKELADYSIRITDTQNNGVQGITVVFNNGKTDVATAETNADGIAIIRTVPSMYYLNFSGVPAGYSVSCDSSMVNSATRNYEAKYLFGDYSAVGCMSVGDAKEGADPMWNEGVLGVGINVITNNDDVNYYTLTGVRGRYTFRIDDEEGKGFISYLSIPKGMGDIALITDGRQQSVEGNIVLGAIRGRNKTYEFTVDVDLGNYAYLVIGYNTGTGNGGKANLVIEQISSNGIYDLHEGANSVEFADTHATLNYTSTPGTDFALSWETAGITITYSVDGEDPVTYTNGTVIEETMGTHDYVFTVTSTSTTNAVFNLTVDQHVYD